MYAIVAKEYCIVLYKFKHEKKRSSLAYQPADSYDICSPVLELSINQTHLYTAICRERIKGA